MPILVVKTICTMIPEGAPLLLKPFLWGVFEAVNRRMVAPRLERHREHVRTSQPVSQPHPMVFQRQIEMRLSQTDGGFFVGGAEPTAADFMMIFPLEMWAKKCPETFGPKCREYVDRIHER